MVLRQAATDGARFEQRPERREGVKLALAALLVVLPACQGSDDPARHAQSLAEAVTNAIYANDPDGVRSNLDDTIKPLVTRAQVGALSDKFHALGAYAGLTFLVSDPTKHEFTYRASFAKGNVNVVVRVAPDGRLAAYRVFTGSAVANPFTY
jgi:hypothetical protein